MKIKNTKYILVLLAGIISLVSGCGCGKGGEGKGSSAEVATLEATHKKLLDELKPLYLEYIKENYAVRGSIYNEADVTKNFEREYTNLEAGSYAAKWKIATSVSDRSLTAGMLLEVFKAISKCKADIETTPSTSPKQKAYLEKKLEFLKNGKEMFKSLLGIDEAKEYKK